MFGSFGIENGKFATQACKYSKESVLLYTKDKAMSLTWYKTRSCKNKNETGEHGFPVRQDEEGRRQNIYYS